MGMSACQTKTLFEGFLVALDLRDFGAEVDNAATAVQQFIEAELRDIRAIFERSSTDKAELHNRLLPVIYWESG